MGELRTAFRPEFLNRVDDIVLFKPLTLGELQQIVGLQTAELGRRLAENGVGLEIDEPAMELIARRGYDPVYGARPLKRYLQHELETRIGRALIAGELGEGSVIRVSVEGGELAVAAGAAAAAESETAPV
jgi:ATP-dependent Clp protease ATP-binding subunit ClpB